MYVRNEMKKDVISIFPDASMSLAFQVMQESNVKNLPVVKGGKLLGMITEKLLSEFSPSKATSLSIYEINYVLSETKVEQIMKMDLVTCTQDMLIEEVAIEMINNDVHMIPVIKGENELVGVITRSDIINAFINMLGSRDTGTRYIFKMEDKPGAFAKIMNTTGKLGVNVTHCTVFDEEKDGLKEVVIKTDLVETEGLDAEFAKEGYNIIRIDKNK